MSSPTVSVIIPTYNRAALLPRALDSVIAQTANDWEIVLVDDGSTDHTPDVAATYSRRLGDRFCVIRCPNAGCGPARNRGIDAARGRFVTFLDSDDEYLPRKLERQLALFRAAPQLGFAYGDYAYIDLEGVLHASVFNTLTPLARAVPHERRGEGLCVCTEELFDHMLRTYFVATIVGMVRRDVLGSGIRWRPVRSYAEEWLFFLKVARRCRGGFVDEPLCLHHHTRGSVTRTDTQRNSIRRHGLHLAMLTDLGRLNRRQRRIVRANLAETAAQIGYDAFRNREYGQATRRFAQAFRAAPQTRMLYHIAHSAAAGLLGASAQLLTGRSPHAERFERTPRA